MADGLQIAAERHAVPYKQVSVIGLGTPGPASATGVLSATGSTNFVHPAWKVSTFARPLNTNSAFPSSTSTMVMRVRSGDITFSSERKTARLPFQPSSAPGWAAGSLLRTTSLKVVMALVANSATLRCPTSAFRVSKSARPAVQLRTLWRSRIRLFADRLERTLLPAYLPLYPDHELAKWATSVKPLV